jgi:hypothetical protein
MRADNNNACLINQGPSDPLRSPPIPSDPLRSPPIPTEPLRPPPNNAPTPLAASGFLFARGAARQST